ncbi:MAG: cytochrome c biogenesis protein CcsA, partial [Tissierellia bacterium]|nr:cytochrome c biogenesis protein CcsA [Tissierellia bacterium]
MENIVFFEEVTFTIALLIYLAATILFFVYLIGRKDKVGKYATNVTIAGLAVHTLSMIFRVIEAGRLPFSNQFEFASSFTWGIVLIFIIIQFRYKFTSLGGFVMPLAFLMMMYASMQSKSINPLMPALQSNWLTIHVGTAVISYGSFAVGCGLAVM